MPVKQFAPDQESGVPFTDYKTKGNRYYKVKRTAVPVNVRAETLNNLFVDKLKSFEYKKNEKAQLKNFYWTSYGNDSRHRLRKANS